MLVYRRARIADVGPLSELAREGLRAAESFPLHIDMPKIVRQIAFFATSPPGHFQLAAFRGDRPVAAIAVYVAEMPVFERCEGHVVMCFTKEQGAGYRLIREMIDWFDGDMRIRRLMWSMNEGADRMGRLMARRFGFKHTHEVLVRYKGE